MYLLSIVTFFFINLVTIKPQDNKTLIVDSGNKIMVVCRAPAHARVTQWYKDGTLLNISGDSRITKTSTNRISRLNIVNIRSSDSGYYHCEASNGQNSSRVYYNIISKYKEFIDKYALASSI